jgi:hypothetical protein
MTNSDFPEGHAIKDKMEIDLDMLGPLMMNRVGSHVHS